MKKKKEISLSLNKKVVSNLNLDKITGGGATEGGLGSCVICQTDNGCTSYDVDKCPFG